MAQNFVGCDRDQELLLPPSLREWLPEDHLVARRPRRRPAQGTRARTQGVLHDFVRRVLATDFGKELYLKRQGSVEPVFGQIKANRGANRFLRRGRAAVRSEWRRLAATHNLRKLHQHHLAAS
jgi:hypothetical protein